MLSQGGHHKAQQLLRVDTLTGDGGRGSMSLLHTLTEAVVRSIVADISPAQATAL